MSTMDISIVPAVGQHLADIGHPLDRHDVTYENAQARNAPRSCWISATRSAAL